jgi:hypothetical protein
MANRMRAANAVDYAKFYSHSHDVVIRVYDESGTVIETHEHKGGDTQEKFSLLLANIRLVGVRRFHHEQITT